MRRIINLKANGIGPDVNVAVDYEVLDRQLERERRKLEAATKTLPRRSIPTAEERRLFLGPAPIYPVIALDGTCDTGELLAYRELTARP